MSRPVILYLGPQWLSGDISPLPNENAGGNFQVDKRAV
jgi:hypothetical protein